LLRLPNFLEHNSVESKSDSSAIMAASNINLVPRAWLLCVCVCVDVSLWVFFLQAEANSSKRCGESRG
jgi:hypothetical protein